VVAVDGADRYPRRVPSTRVLAVLVVAVLALTACDGGPPMRASVSATSASPTVARSATQGAPTPKSSASTKADKLAAYLAKLPQFPAPPTPVPIKVPTGPRAPIYYRMPVKAPVAFLTMDDGIEQLPQDLAIMSAAHIQFTMFLIGPVAAKNPPFFKQLVTDGGQIEDHTLTHPELKGKSYAYQKNQICGARTTLTKTFGRAPVLFRPPFGDYDNTTLQVTHDCGLKAAFYWSETARNGKVFYQTSVHKIKPGDIILMHFRSTFAADLLAALTAIHKAGLTPALLEDYIVPSKA
jgi:peptidoglycan/xylan/chitin deacetylase (PgdA/CDA1 family)